MIHTHRTRVPIHSAGAALAALCLVSWGCTMEEERDGMGRDLDVGTAERNLETEGEVSAHVTPGGEIAADPAQPSSEGIPDQTLSVELEVPAEEGYSVEIEEIYLADDQLLVISRLEGPGTTSDAMAAGELEEGADDAPWGKKISDTVIVHAPPLEVSHYIIGDQPPTIGSDIDYHFIQNRSEIDDLLRNATRVYRSMAASGSEPDTAPRYSQLLER